MTVVIVGRGWDGGIYKKMSFFVKILKENSRNIVYVPVIYGRTFVSRMWNGKTSSKKLQYSSYGQKLRTTVVGKLRKYLQQAVVPLLLTKT